MLILDCKDTKKMKDFVDNYRRIVQVFFLI
jgi:hypothetical protein